MVECAPRIAVPVAATASLRYGMRAALEPQTIDQRISVAAIAGCDAEEEQRRAARRVGAEMST